MDPTPRFPGQGLGRSIAAKELAPGPSRNGTRHDGVNVGSRPTCHLRRAESRSGSVTSNQAWKQLSARPVTVGPGPACLGPAALTDN